MQRKRRKQQTVRFLHRTLLFLVTFSYAIAIIFIFGNIQDFLDSTQLLILGLLDVSALATALLAIPLIFLELFFFFAKKRALYLSLAGIAVFGLLSGILLSAGGHLIILLSRGL
jgi:hypothetical protein